MTKNALDKIVDDLVEWHNSLDSWTEHVVLKQDLKNLVRKHAPHRIGQLT